MIREVEVPSLWDVLWPWVLLLCILGILGYIAWMIYCRRRPKLAGQLTFAGFQGAPSRPLILNTLNRHRAVIGSAPKAEIRVEGIPQRCLRLEAVRDRRRIQWVRVCNISASDFDIDGDTLPNKESKILKHGDRITIGSGSIVYENISLMNLSFV